MSFKVHEPYVETNEQAHCGPVILSAILGKPYWEVENLIGNPKKVNFKSLQTCLRKNGIKAKITHLYKYGSSYLPTLDDWLKCQAYKKGKSNQVWVVGFANHTILVQDGKYIDDRETTFEPVDTSLFTKQLVSKVMKVG